MDLTDVMLYKQVKSKRGHTHDFLYIKYKNIEFLLIILEIRMCFQGGFGNIT